MLTDNDLEAIHAFCAATGCTLHRGTVGFGRSCVGIDDGHEHWLAYEDWPASLNGNEPRCHHTAYTAKPQEAYSKGPFLAVEYGDISEEEATRKLEEWVVAIIKEGFELETYVDNYSFPTCFTGPLELPLIVDATEEEQS